MNLKKKLISVASAAALAVTGLTGLSASADTPLITNGGPYTGNASYISTYLKTDYFGNSAFKIKYEYVSKDADGKITDENNQEKDIDYTDTFEFLVFDQNWGGWDKTTVGQANPVVGTEYEATVLISDIESKLSTTGSSVQGINLQTGGIGDAQVKITSLEYVAGTVASQEVNITGSWVKGTGGTMTVSEAGGATVSTNEWNIQVSQFSVSQFANPRVDVTVEYTTAPNTYVQAELQKTSGTPVVANYPNVTSTGTVTYTTEIPTSLTAFLACFDSCTVKSIHIYDYTAGNVAKSVSGKTATEVAADMGMAWNLGNSFDAVDDQGNVSETIWGNEITRKELFIAVKNAGFNTIRIPVSYMNMINSDNSVNSDYLERLEVVIRDAYNMGMYVVINIHNDGGNGITGKWLDITKTGDEFTAIKNKFAGVWTSIATYFKDYDQKLVFEGFNELMNGDYGAAPTTAQIANVNTLNTAFVNAVRAAGGSNADRVLIVAGYNTNIDNTIAGFEVPEDSSEDRLMLSVHYYDPYQFTDENYGTDSWSNDSEGSAMQTAINNICSFADTNNMPVFIGEYSVKDKNNTSTRGEYIYYLNKYAASNTAGAKVVLAYWDNGVTSTYGTALFDRTNNTITTTGTTLVSYITAGYNKTNMPS